MATAPDLASDLAFRLGEVSGESVLALDYAPFLAEARRAIEMGIEAILGGSSGKPARVPSPQTIPQKVQVSMQQTRVLRIVYDRKYDPPGSSPRPPGNEYMVRPYEVKPHPISGRQVLYAQDEHHGGQIHSFLWDRLQGVMMTNRKFAPTWPTRPESVP